jgi:hypothetical protein
MTGLTRRAFAESLAVAALAPVLGLPAASVPAVEWSPPKGGFRASAGALARALARAIRAQYGSRLSAKDLATVTDQIQSALERVDRLRKVPLTNGDEPDFVFSAFSRSSPRR